MIDNAQLAVAVHQNVAAALHEDIATGDLTALLIPADRNASAHLICRDAAVICGRPWFEACFRMHDSSFKVKWHADEGQPVLPDQILCEFSGNARALLTAERTAINFLQTLSATATATRHLTQLTQGLSTLVMDTRKTIPGLRLAQKYAVLTGGGSNQRIGLFDGILIKENHIAAAGGIAAALAATQNAAVPVQIEVENLQELEAALQAGAVLILLDNFDLDQLRAAVKLTHGRAILEASGGIDMTNLRAIAETGVQRVSIGSITKHIQAVDLSMRMD